MMITIIWAALLMLGIWFIILLVRDIVKHKNVLEKINVLKTAIIGFTVNFFDVLGIGAFAPQTALLKFTKQTDDSVMPGTLNVTNTIPVVIQALIFIKIIEVDVLTLVLMLLSAMIGAILGANIISSLPVKSIRLIMGFALLVTAGFMFARKMNWIQGGGDAIALSGTKLIIAVAANFILGALMTAGIGLYAPCMALVFALGMSPQVAFPIMMGSCAFLMPPASAKFISKGAYNRKATVAMTIPGSIAVLVAAYFVKSLPLENLKIAVIIVILITSAMMFKDAFKKAAVL
ncbi:MAG TPA: sulfite exporter TauE/SafE family protein [Puia sp.]|nr:sulfite exporter TauE/SafE family protein [Puia sp.]